MFKISPVQDCNIAKDYLNFAKRAYRPSAFLYAMTDVETGDLMGLAQFEILGSSAMIYDIATIPDRSDFESMFILGRQTMNFIDSCGAHICYAAECSADASYLKSIGFKKSAEGFVCDMHGMFDGHCSH